MKSKNKILSEALVKNNVLSAQDIKWQLSEAQTVGEPLGDFLLERGLVTEKQIMISLSQMYDLETVDLTQVNIDQDVIDKIPIKFSWFYQFMPISLDNNILTIATIYPLDVKVQDEIRMHLGYKVKVKLTEETGLKDAIKRYYGFASDMIDRIMAKDAMKTSSLVVHNDHLVEDIERQTEDPTVSQLVNQIILEAYKKRATDIHIEPYRNKVRFRYRIDGRLVDANLPDEAKHFLQPILSRIKILANLTITEKRLPQDGSAVVKTKDQQIDLRISTMPTPRGESMVIRILPRKVMLFSLEKLGFNTAILQDFRDLLSKPHGVLFMTGPTGSGKTTTLYACLNEINGADRKIITIEDPVEYEMEGITQVQVNPKVNFNFSDGLRSILRHDPDIIMVGEVRDIETAKIAIRTALTGHLVFSTLHTNDSASGITRLIDMGVEPYLVASSVEAFIAQRLIRVICPKCKQIVKNPPAAIIKEMAEYLQISDLKSIKVYEGKGCQFCNKTGYLGRVAVYEILVLNDAIRGAILEKARSDYIKKIAIKHGLVTLRKNAWKAVLDGITTPEEVLNVTIKDDPFLDESPRETKVAKVPFAPARVSSENNQDIRSSRGRRKGPWESKNQFDARIFQRAFSPVEIRYRLLKLDPEDPNFLLPDEVEYTTVTEDISAGGMRFISNDSYPIGSILEMKINLGDKYPTVNCLAKVCRVEKDHLDKVYTMVNYYLDLSGADKVSIIKFVNEMMKEEKKKEVPSSKENY